jgi:hypothetical protein
MPRNGSSARAVIVGACGLFGLACGSNAPPNAGGLGDFERDRHGDRRSAGGSATGNGGSAGSGSSGSSAGASGSSPFTVNIALSSQIPTVGVVTWSSTVSIDSAVINFGRDQTNFEYQAAVDLTQTNYRTLLLGMKQSTTYYVQVVAKSGSTSYSSAVSSIKTGFLPNGIPVFTVNDMMASSLYAGGGFTVNCTGLAGGPGIGGTAGKSWGLIFDKDGDVVWAYDFTSTGANGCSRARMSYDGAYMWAGNFAWTATGASTTGALTRIPMDGSGTAQDFSLPGRSHDFAILPNGDPMYFTADNGLTGPDTIKELDPSSGNSTTIYDESTDYSSLLTTSMGAHTNQVNYVPALNAISFSMLFPNTVGLISYPAGKVVETFGGTQSTFPNMTWSWQHGHEVLSDHIWIFNNQGTDGSADVLGFQFDTSSNTTTQILDYKAGIACLEFGDVKELPNGNLYLTYSIGGDFREITPSGTLLREVTTSNVVGYSEHRASLYGPPPPFDM